MATQVSIFADGSALPAHIIGGTDSLTSSLVNTGAAGKRISIKGGVFRMLVDGKEVATNEERAMNVVVVAAAPHNNRQYYSKQYVEGEAVAPDCWSIDSRTPAADATDKQSTSCATCPQNIKGSGQGDSRACRYQRRLAVVLEGDLGGEIYQLALPATSIFGDGVDGKKLPLQAYATFLKNNQVSIGSVVTEMKFDTDVSTPKLTFRPVRPLTKDELDTCIAQGQSPEAKQAIDLTVTQTDKVASKPAAITQEADTPEPTKVTSTAKAAPAGRPSMAQVIAEFDD